MRYPAGIPGKTRTLYSARDVIAGSFRGFAENPHAVTNRPIQRPLSHATQHVSTHMLLTNRWGFGKLFTACEVPHPVIEGNPMGTAINPDAWYATADVPAIIPGTSPSGLAQMRSRGQGPAYTQHTRHGRVLYRGRDLIAWLEAGRKLPRVRASAT